MGFVKHVRVLAFLFIMCFAAGCASNGEGGLFSSSESEPTAPYYFAEFPDVPIPSGMDEKSGKSYITFTSSGLKCGVQHFSGRIEAVSLMNEIRRNMASQGWTLRGLLRSKDSVLVFDKDSTVCSMFISDGMIYTDMIVFVTAKLSGDNAAASSYYTPEGAYSGTQPLAQ